MLEFLQQYPRLTQEGSSGPSLAILNKILLGRDPILLDVRSYTESIKAGLSYEWHEYGAYIGIIPLLLFGFGAVKRFRKNWPLLFAGLICLLLLLGRGSPINLWGILKSIPIYSSLKVPPRFGFAFMFAVAIFSGFGFSYLEKFFLTLADKKNKVFLKILPLLILLFILFDLLYVNSPIFKNALRVMPNKPIIK